MSWYKIIDQIPKDPVFFRQEDSNFRLKQQCTCECGKSHTFYCQEDNNPEYYTTISLSCPCGKLIQMEFPVN